MVFTVLVNIILCPFSHISIAKATSLYVFVQDVSNPTLLNHIDALKARLDRLRPLPPELVDNLREVYDIRLTYHSNAIEGNTLTQSETQIVVEKGITIGGKPLKDHLQQFAIEPTTN